MKNPITYFIAMFFMLCFVKDAQSNTNDDMYCLSEAIYFEARSQSIAGQLAVAEVVITRSKERKQSYCQVVRDKAQFSYYWDGKPERLHNKKAWNLAKSLAKFMHNNYEFTTIVDDANLYHADYVDPKWTRSNKVEFITQVGTHVFYKEHKRALPIDYTRGVW